MSGIKTFINNPASYIVPKNLCHYCTMYKITYLIIYTQKYRINPPTFMIRIMK